MDDVQLGRRFRVLRHRLGWRQSDVAAKAGMSQDTVSRIERGRLAEVTLPRLRSIATTLGAELRIQLDFRGGELDRLMDEGHVVLVGAVASRLEALGWEIRPEVSFAIYADRGSIDIVAWHAASRTLLVIEVKTGLTSIEETLRTLDMKVRRAAEVVGERFGWRPVRVARLLVLPDTSTARAQARRHDQVLRPAFPLRGPALRAWLREPHGSVRGLAFVPYTRSARGSRPGAARKRIRSRGTATDGASVSARPGASRS